MSTPTFRTTKERAPSGSMAKPIALRLRAGERKQVEEIAGDKRTLNAVARELLLEGLKARHSSGN